MADVVPTDRFARLPERYQRRAREIARRVSEIDALCRYAAPDEIGAELKRLRGQFRPQPDVDNRDMAASFLEACRDLPAWVISEAANDFLCGRVDNHTGQFMPTSAEFAKRARAILIPFLSERVCLRQEADKIVERAADEARRLRIEAERRSPEVRNRVEQLKEMAARGAAKMVSFQHKGISEDAASRLDALRRPRQFVSKLEETPIVKSARKAAE